MSLIAAAVFAMVRYGLALVPRLALVWPLKKIAAVASLTVTLAYLAVSGFDVAAQRAFVMLAVVLSAVMLDRPALTMRSVAVAAVVDPRGRAREPDARRLPDVLRRDDRTGRRVRGLRGRAWWQATNERRWRLRAAGARRLRHLAGGRGWRRRPYSAFHFNMLGQYGLVANMLAMPAMGLVVMPAAVVALFLAPLGLDGLGFTVMGWGVGYVLAVAEWVADLGGAAVGVPAGPAASLGLISLGGLVLVLWIGRGRWAGLAPIAAGVALWAAADRPDLLIADDGRLFGIATAGRAGAVGARGPRLRGGELARGRRRPREPGRGICPWRAGAAAAPDRGRRAGARAAGLRRQPRRGGAGGRMRGGGGADRAELGATRPRGGASSSGASGCARDGALAIRITGRGLAVEGARASGRPWSGIPPRDASDVRVARMGTRAHSGK